MPYLELTVVRQQHRVRRTRQRLRLQPQTMLNAAEADDHVPAIRRQPELVWRQRRKLQRRGDDGEALVELGQREHRRRAFGRPEDDLGIKGERGVRCEISTPSASETSLHHHDQHGSSRNIAPDSSETGGHTPKPGLDGPRDACSRRPWVRANRIPTSCCPHQVRTATEYPNDGAISDCGADSFSASVL